MTFILWMHIIQRDWATIISDTTLLAHNRIIVLESRLVTLHIFNEQKKRRMISHHVGANMGSGLVDGLPFHESYKRDSAQLSRASIFSDQIPSITCCTGSKYISWKHRSDHI